MTQGFWKMGICFVLVMIGWEDIKSRRISNKRLGVLLCVVLAYRWAYPTMMPDKIIGMLIVSIPMLLLAILWPGCFGGGDIKLMCVCGILLGSRDILRASWFSLCLAAVYCGWLLLAGKGGKTEFSLGPFISSGVCVLLLEIL